METLESLKKTVDNLISTEESRLGILKNIKLLLNSDELNGQSEFSLMEPTENRTHRREINDSDYPKHGSMISKVDYLLSKEGKALQSFELIELIARNEKPSVERTCSRV
jgi:hypothetical protein